MKMLSQRATKRGFDSRCPLTLMHASEIKSARLLDLLCATLLLSFALAMACPRWRAGIDWRDEGLLAYGAVRVMHGDVRSAIL